MEYTAPSVSERRELVGELGEFPIGSGYTKPFRPERGDN